MSLRELYRCLTTDVITDCAVPQSTGLLEEEYSAGHHSRFLRNITRLSLWKRQFPVIVPISDAVPQPFVALSPGPAFSIYDTIKLKDKQAAMIVEATGALTSSKTYPIIMNEVFQSNLPKGRKHMTDSSMMRPSSLVQATRRLETLWQ